MDAQHSFCKHFLDDFPSAVRDKRSACFQCDWLAVSPPRKTTPTVRASHPPSHCRRTSGVSEACGLSRMPEASVLHETEPVRRRPVPGTFPFPTTKRHFFFLLFGKAINEPRRLPEGSLLSHLTLAHDLGGRYTCPLKSLQLPHSSLSPSCTQPRPLKCPTTGTPVMLKALRPLKTP